MKDRNAEAVFQFISKVELKHIHWVLKRPKYTTTELDHLRWCFSRVNLPMAPTPANRTESTSVVSGWLSHEHFGHR